MNGVNMLVKIERYKVGARGERGRVVCLPTTWAESTEAGKELDMFVDSLTGALVIPDPSKPIPETGEPLAVEPTS
jgi:hypothetical protein